MKSHILFYLLLLSSQLGVAQYSITGLVKDQQNVALTFANVLLLYYADSSLVEGAITEEGGQFNFSNIKEGSYLLQISMIGYDAVTSDPINLATDLRELEFILSETSTELEAVTVTAKKPFFEQQIDRMVVNVQNSIVSTGSNALAILERSPGIEIDRMSNQIRMQGKNGVIVMLDGKMMRMDELGLMQLLQSMPSDNIVSIELITTPPASFDAEGNAGIINIITNKNNANGLSSNLTLNTAYGIRPKFGGSFALNYRNQKWSFYTDLSANYNLTEENAYIFRQNTFEGLTTQTQLNSSRPAAIGLYNYRFGVDYDWSERTTIGVMASGYWSTWDMNAFTESIISDNQGGGFTSLLNGHEVNNWTHWMVNVNIRHTFLNGGKLTLDFDYLDFFDNNPTDYFDRTFSQDGQPMDTASFISRKETPVSFKVFKVDYAKSLSDKVQIETGIKGTLTSFVNDLRLANEINGVLVDDPFFTDIFTLEEALGALYGSIDFRPSQLFTLKAGLRYEYYDSDLISNNDGDILLQSYGRLFPSINMSYQPNEQYQFQISYSERITRPSIGMVAPAFYIWGYNTILGGNPALRPTITKNLNASLRWKTILFQLQYSDAENSIVYQPTVVPEDNLLFSQAENLPRAQTAMFGVNLPIRLTPWWEGRYNVAANWLQHQSFIEGATIRQSNWYVNANMTQNFSLPNGLSLEMAGRLRTPLMWGIGRVPFMGSIDLGVKKQLSDKASISLNWNDIFDWGSFFNIDYNQPELNIWYDWFYEMEGSIFRLNFAYQFGNQNIKAKENRATGSEEEQSRVN